MHDDCVRMGHRLGLVWVAAGDGIIARLHEDYAKSAQLLRGAIEDLERVPWVYDAARLRRWLADVLIRLGDQEDGVRELRKSHEICAALGARVEMERARDMMKLLGLRPPSREARAPVHGQGRRQAAAASRAGRATSRRGRRRATWSIAASRRRTRTCDAANVPRSRSIPFR